MKTAFTISFLFIIFSLSVYCQSDLTFEVGTDLKMQAGADLCADKVLISGTWNGDGTICDGVMPVILASINAKTEGNKVKLYWVTTGEINNSGFDIERKDMKDAALWKKISFVAGSGTTDITRIYSFEDKKIPSGKYSYRLKQIDFNGNFEYFNLEDEVIIDPPGSFSMSQNYPNPSNPKSKIDFETPIDGNVTIKLYDVKGSEVTVILNESKPAGYYSAEIDGTNLASGTYFYTITAGNYKMTKRMILVK